MKFDCYVVSIDVSIRKALEVINANKQGFAVVQGHDGKVLGVLTDGDVRRGIINGYTAEDSIDGIFTRGATVAHVNDSFEKITEYFKNPAIKFLPIVDEEGRLANIITKSQMYALLLYDIHASLDFDFSSLDTCIVDHEIFFRPWGYYRTTVLNDYFQTKIISVKPQERLSMQSHKRREEYWTVAHGTGIAILDESEIQLTCGQTIFVPRGCRHRLINSSETESLIITELQIGDYLGEDDIIRYEDDYGRA